MVTDATRPADKVQHDTVTVLVVIVLAFCSAMIQCTMWKRDISKAFRDAPCGLHILISRGCMPFGATSQCTLGIE